MVAASLVLLLAVAGPASPTPRVLKTGDHVSFRIPATDPSWGPAGAPITLVELTDFQCPFCRQYNRFLESLLARYPGKVHFVHHDFPLDIHENAAAAAEAARCAGEQNRFWEMRRALFTVDSTMELFDIKVAAGYARVQRPAFEACVASHRYKAVVQESIDEARKLGFQATPSLILNGTVFVGIPSGSTLEQALDAAVEPKSKDGL
jgi:protein-disulfide isomerase